MTMALALVGDGVPQADELRQIELARALERSKLEAAERDMLARATTDREGFVEAKSRRDAAALAIEQLEWAEKAEHQRREQVARDAKMAKLHAVQEEARMAHGRAGALADQVVHSVRELAAVIKALQECQAAIDRGVHHEQFAVSAGDIPKGTVRPRLVLDADNAVLALRAAKEYLRLCQVSEQLADMRASQGKL